MEAPTAPNINIKEFPIKKAINVEITPIDLLFENLEKSGVRVPPLINEPIQRLSPTASPKLFAGSIAKSSEIIETDFKNFMDTNEKQLTEVFQKNNKFQTSVLGLKARGNFPRQR